MAEQTGLKAKATGLIDNIKYYWTEPPKGKYMSFKEVAAYSVGGIGAYFLISMGAALVVSTTNMIVGGAIGVAPMDMYVLYLISTLANIPLTAVRANMVDNTRGKGGKYRPYLISMGIPTAVISLAYVWFPYDSMYSLFSGKIMGYEGGYIAKCVMVLIFNLLLQFFFNFFQDAYTNLIHVLSPNTQERTDVLAIKSVVYSLAPSIINIVLPLVAQFATNNDLYDIRVYRISYPVFAVLGMVLTIMVYANTQEKIVQAKTHTIQISFIDSFKAVAKNKYFWIIALAGWIGFLESAYGNILTWVCILSMIINMRSIWWLFICVYFNWLVGAFEQITTPAIQADIRDYQQYRSGERIDGMFATVLTIGNIVTLLTSAVLPAVYQRYGVYEGNGYKNSFDILDVNNGDPDLLYKLMSVLIIMAAVGAFLNMAPYFFYDFNEKKQKSVIRVLQVRSLFEDFGNKALNNHQIVEAIDMVNNAREMAVATPKTVDKSSYRNISDKAERKAAKKQYRADLEYNEEIEISQFVCKELDKFGLPVTQHQVAEYSKVYALGLDGIKSADLAELRRELAAAKAMPKDTEDEKEIRSFSIEIAKKKISAKKAHDKYYGTVKEFVSPDMEALTELFNREDDLDARIAELVEAKEVARKARDLDKVRELRAEIKNVQAQRKSVLAKSKALQDEFARFNRAAKPYNDAQKLLVQEENYKHFDEIAALYDEAKAAAAEEDKQKEARLAEKRAEEEAELARRKAEKAAKKRK